MDGNKLAELHQHAVDIQTRRDAVIEAQRIDEMQRIYFGVCGSRSARGFLCQSKHGHDGAHMHVTEGGAVWGWPRES